jgi:glutaminyl-tRNA synthetase
MAVLNPLKVIIENYPNPQPESIQAPIHPQNEAMGKREIFFGRELYIDRADFEMVAPDAKFQRLALDKEIRLRNSYIIKALRVEHDATGQIQTVYASYDPETLGKNPADGRKVKGVIHFVEASRAVPAEFRLYDRLFSVANPGKADDFESVMNPNSLQVQHGFVEPGLVNSQPEQAYQFEREGYFCRDNQAGLAQIYNRTVALRDTWGV